MSTLAERWIAAVNAAIELSTPAEIVANIRAADAPDDGLRAASYEPRTKSGHLSDSHPERMTLEQQHERKVSESRKYDETIAVSRAGLKFIDAISEINASRDEGTADNWDDALIIANALAELHGGHHIASAIDTADDLDPYHQTIGAVSTLTRLAHRWGCPHVATIQERLQHPDVCLSHARIDVERPVCGRLVVCKMCRDLLAEWADPPKVHRDPDAWPTSEMLAADLHGETVEYRKLRAEYLAHHGVSPTARRFRVLSKSPVVSSGSERHSDVG